MDESYFPGGIIVPGVPGIGVPVPAPLEVPGLPAPELSGVPPEVPGVPDAPEPELPEPLLPPEPSGALLEPLLP
ncbi:MAG: hypothetical protein H7244_14985 [Herminiimonas sp.]|nr:hypothetical protein [Herminiimonas sp.]